MLLCYWQNSRNQFEKETRRSVVPIRRLVSASHPRLHIFKTTNEPMEPPALHYHLQRALRHVYLLKSIIHYGAWSAKKWFVILEVVPHCVENEWHLLFDLLYRWMWDLGILFVQWVCERCMEWLDNCGSKVGSFGYEEMEELPCELHLPHFLNLAIRSFWLPLNKYAGKFWLYGFFPLYLTWCVKYVFLRWRCTKSSISSSDWLWTKITL